MVGMLVIVAVGYVAGELDYLDDHTIEHISNLVIDIAMPCLVVSSATELDPSAASTEVPWSFALATVLWFALLGTCLLCNHLLRTPREQHGPYLFAGTCTNTSFPGIPIAFAILGQRSAVGASIFDMVTTVFNFTIGFAILSASERTIGDVFVLHHFCPQSLRSTPRHFETHPHRCSSAPRCSRRTPSAT